MYDGLGDRDRLVGEVGLQDGDGDEGLIVSSGDGV